MNLYAEKYQWNIGPILGGYFVINYTLIQFYKNTEKKLLIKKYFCEIAFMLNHM